MYAAEPAADEIPELVRIGQITRSECHRGADLLAELVVRNADDRRLGDRVLVPMLLAGELTGGEHALTRSADGLAELLRSG